MAYSKTLLFLAFLCFTFLSSFSDFRSIPTENFRLKHFNIEDKLAIEGYDPVSYFQKKPKEGSSSIRVKYLGITYQFSSEVNKKIFNQNPENYLPQYGGWCAFAMGDKGEKVEIDPETYKIVNGKLYLFYNAYFTNTLTSWNKSEQKFLIQANQKWSKFK